jgi:AhpD family alkylhydroperoxidase
MYLQHFVVMLGSSPGMSGRPSTRRRRRIALTAGMSAKRRPIEYGEATAEVRAVYDDIMATRKTDWVNNFWKVLAHDPPTLRRIWANIKQVMGPGALDPLTKELLYVAVSASNGCHYCIASHGAAARSKGMTEAQYSELLAIVGLANETNRLVTALGVAIDPQFLQEDHS